MENIKIYKNTETDGAIRLDRFLVDQTGLTRNQVQRQIAKGLVEVDGLVVTKNGFKLSGEIAVKWTEPEVEQATAEPEDIPLDIVYEDSDIIVVNKPAGMVVHPAVGHFTGTLVNGLLHHCKDLQGIGGVIRPGIVHRIDMDTSGILVVAKNDDAHNHLAAQFKDHSIDRIYKAFLFGHLPEQVATISSNIARHKNDRKKYAVSEDRGKLAITHYKMLSAFGELCHVQLQLETGRTHQIRVHMSHIGHPIIGDSLYCHSRRVAHIRKKRLQDRLRGIKRQMLHAETLGFIHPASGEKMDFKVDMPEDMSSLLQWLNEEYLEE